jgi:hypothetical protein
MGLEVFKDAYEALPESADGSDIIDFVAGVVVSYMPPEEAMKALIKASVKVAEFAAEYGSLHTECECNACVEKREAEKPKH